MNVVVPLTGGGKFTAGGTSKPFYLLEVDGIPLYIAAAVSVGVNTNVIYICSTEHDRLYDLRPVIRDYFPNGKLIATNKRLKGTAHACLQAIDFINNDDPVMVIDPSHLGDVPLATVHDMCVDDETTRGVIMVTNEVKVGEAQSWIIPSGESNMEFYPKFVTLDNPENPEAYSMAGIYYWKYGFDFVRCASHMVDQDIRTNGKIEVPMVYNVALMNNMAFSVFGIHKSWFVKNTRAARKYLRDTSKDE